MVFLNSMDVSASGLTAQRLRLDVITNNIANVNTTRTESGGPYRRKRVVFQERNNSSSFDTIFSDAKKEVRNKKGVRVIGIEEDLTPFKLKYDPSHPDADERGYVHMPNIDIAKEMVDMISALRTYEANVTALNSTKSMIMKALDIGKV